MAVEIEVKIKVANHDIVRGKLQELRAKPTGDHLETNTFFDTPDRALLAADKGLRLRVNRDAVTGHEERIVTFKGPKQTGQFKSRDEIETAVDNAPATAALFAALGFEPGLTFEKRRQSWSLDGCKVELDEMPYLGTFVEVEGPGDQAVQGVREKLGLADAGQIKTSYIEMLMDYLKGKGITDRKVVFPKT